MAWTEKDEARKVHKFLKCGVLYPEDLKANEIRLLKQYRPVVHQYVTGWLAYRQEKIEAGEWSEGCEPPISERRINRLDKGKSVVDPYNEP